MNKQDTTLRKQIKVRILSQKDLSEAIQLITETFCQINPVWSHYVKDEQIKKQLYFYVSEFVTTSRQSDLLYACLDAQTHQMISVGVYLDMVDYVDILTKIKGKYDHIKLVSQLGVCGAELEKDLRAKKHVRGVSVIVVLGASKKSLNKNQYASYTYISIQRDLYLRGYQYLYGRCTNQLSRRIMTKFGGEVINMLTIEENKLKMYLVQADLDKQLQLNDQGLNEIWKNGVFIHLNI